MARLDRRREDWRSSTLATAQARIFAVQCPYSARRRLRSRYSREMVTKAWTLVVIALALIAVPTTVNATRLGPRAIRDDDPPARDKTVLATAPVFQPGDAGPVIASAVAAVFLVPCIAWLAHSLLRWWQHRTRLLALLTVVWAIYTLYQLCLLVYTSTYTHCRYPFLYHTPFPSWPNCVAPWFLTALIFLQCIGAALFVVATISQFQDAFALLSTRHLLVCRALTVLVAIVATLRLISTLLWEAIADSRVSPFLPSSTAAIRRFDKIMHPALFAVLGVCDLTALLLGLTFVLGIQRDLQVHMSASFHGISRAARHAELAHTRHMVAAIGVSLMALVVFLLVQAPGVLPVIDVIPVVLVNAMNTALLKVYSSCTMLTIAGMKEMLLVRQKLLEFGGGGGEGTATTSSSATSGVVTPLAEWRPGASVGASDTKRRVEAGRPVS
ncbi:hypothetical protein AMAG_04582 [Allomyces macrogynus ATCC 38327]|uniref:Uncharacterized protein n=1 Tax=Allomyces macrogynus (strain ATCC 38327) TaxID=578462 RepID=A0A0L0S5A8_ALLM3|nr:hypothetical protein AMAG_04582 [Allomyces macrogynus ATCC 38327]|eukprot:KNE57723.1 hypothetical protein AMAG_04582 [Allomyces macrogynus ATCC 38327]